MKGFLEAQVFEALQRIWIGGPRRPELSMGHTGPWQRD